jgi:hypothetical protein
MNDLHIKRSADTIIKNREFFFDLPQGYDEPAACLCGDRSQSRFNFFWIVNWRPDRLYT